MRVQLGGGFWTSRFGLAVFGGALALGLAGAMALTYYYVHFANLIAERLTGQIFQTTSRVYSAPGHISVGEALTPRDLQDYLERAGYSQSDLSGTPGSYRVNGSTVELRPADGSYVGKANSLRVDFVGNQVARISSLATGQSLTSAELEPVALTNLFDSSREKRRFVRYEDVPGGLVDAVLAAEDKRFFEHPGFDFLRILGAAWADVRRGSKAQGASTITMQVARSFFFSQRRTWRRKVAETLMSLELEQRFNKRQIFELYANEVYLGNRGSFAIRGFGEAAQAYFGKDVHDLNLAESAFLAGIIRAPNRYSSADRRPERAMEARDRVLSAMLDDQFVTPKQAEAARKAKLTIASGTMASSEAPYFVDMVKDDLLERFSEPELVSQSYRVYTTLDPALQHAAAETIATGMKAVDEALARRNARRRKRGEPLPQAQVALIALNPRTGEIKALVGGRDYGQSQLNHVLARRQPGSAFKPFVYASAFSNAADGLQPLVTPTTTVVDEPTTFQFEGQEYTPNNYGEQFYGAVTVRQALMHSLNVATVKVAEMVGYDRVAVVARQMGLGTHIRGTPAVALGAYEMTPLEVAAGYTIFANLGTRAEPFFVRGVVGADGTVLEQHEPRTRPALDPRVAYLVTSLLEDVLDHGTAAGVRARGFTAPAAAKTGTSHDGWFAGFTSNLLCVVWIGYDDNRELNLTGAASAAPIWAEFMKRAVLLPDYQNPQPFAAPQGVIEVTIDPETLQVATPACPTTRQEVFVAGSEPTQYCERHGGKALAEVPPVSWLSRLFGGKNPSPPPPPGTAPAGQPAPGGSTSAKPGSNANAAPGQNPPGQPAADQPEKKNPLQRFFGIFAGKKKEPDKQEKPEKPDQPN